MTDQDCKLTQRDELVAHYGDLIAKAVEPFHGLRLSQEPGDGLVTPDEIRAVTWPLVADLHSALDRLPDGPCKLIVSLDKETREVIIDTCPDVAKRLERLADEIRRGPIAGAPRTKGEDDGTKTQEADPPCSVPRRNGGG